MNNSEIDGFLNSFRRLKRNVKKQVISNLASIESHMAYERAQYPSDEVYEKRSNYKYWMREKEISETRLENLNVNKLSRKWLNNEIEKIKELELVKDISLNSKALCIWLNKLDWKWEGMKFKGNSYKIVIQNDKYVFYAIAYDNIITTKDGRVHPHIYRDGHICCGGETGNIISSIIGGSLYLALLSIIEILELPDNDNPVFRPEIWQTEGLYAVS